MRGLSYGERRRKLCIVSEFMGFDGPRDLLEHYRDKSIVPGICTDQFCDWIMNVECNEVADLCPHCEANTMQSILVFACVN
jgi:hypothetical protein